MKGQIFSIDFMIGLVVFLIIMALIFFTGTLNPVSAGLSIQSNANQIADFLVTTKLGNENILSCHKITSLANKTYEEIRNETGASPFDIYIEFKNTTKMCSGSKINIGMIPSSSIATTSVLRIVNIDGSKATAYTMQMIVRLYD